jgi:hypothetical protein
MTGDFNNTKVSNDAHVEIGARPFSFIKGNDQYSRETNTYPGRQNFVTQRIQKKLAGSTDHPCVQTGKAEECLCKDG